MPKHLGIPVCGKSEADPPRLRLFNPNDPAASLSWLVEAPKRASPPAPVRG